MPESIARAPVDRCNWCTAQQTHTQPVVVRLGTRCTAGHVYEFSLCQQHWEEHQDEPPDNFVCSIGENDIRPECLANSVVMEAIRLSSPGPGARPAR